MVAGLSNFLAVSQIETSNFNSKNLLERSVSPAWWIKHIQALPPFFSKKIKGKAFIYSKGQHFRQGVLKHFSLFINNSKKKI